MGWPKMFVEDDDGCVAKEDCCPKKLFDCDVCWEEALDGWPKIFVTGFVAFSDILVLAGLLSEVEDCNGLLEGLELV